jgi:hypothetical protein
MKNNRQPDCRGFTMVEMMGAVFISVILIMLLFQIFNKVQSVLVVSQNRARVMEQGRNALDILAQDFRSLDAASVWDPFTLEEMPNISWYEDKALKINLLDSIVQPSQAFQPLISPMEVTDPLRFSYLDQGHALQVHWHQCKFFTNDEGWRFVDYKFGGRNHYKTMDPASPVGALWVYRSRVVRRSGLGGECKDHSDLINHDPLPDPSYDPGSDSHEQDGLVGYSRVVDGVIHFRVRAVSPLDPGGAFGSPADSFYTGRHAPSLVEVEIALVDGNLVAEMEAGIEQSMEGEAALLKFDKKLNYIKDNLDRVYFFKQLINIQGRGQ